MIKKFFLDNKNRYGRQKIGEAIPSYRGSLILKRIKISWHEFSKTCCQMQQPCFTIEGEVKNFGFHILGPIIQLELMLFDPSLPISTMVYKIISRMTSDFQHKILIRIDLPSHTLFDSIKAFQNCLKYLLFFLVTKKGSPFLHYHFAPPCFHNYIFLKRGANEGG